MRIASYDVSMSAKSASFMRSIGINEENFALDAINSYASFSELYGERAHQISSAQASERMSVYTDGKQVSDGSAQNSKILANFAKHGVEILHSFKTKTLDEDEQNAAAQMVFSHASSQALSIKTSAKIICSDGCEMSVELDYTFHGSAMRFGRLTRAALYDPLVIALEGALPTLGSGKFSFDIDSDGTSDQISMLGANSGFLVRDIDENGKIDVASELFGAQNGDGFADLARFDDDQNGWIDENDKIFDKLRIWQKTDNGDRLIAIGEIGIGAIFLGATKADFGFLDGFGSERARMRSSGFFLYEDGKSGVISQIDMVKLPKDTPNTKELFGLKFDLTERQNKPNIAKNLIQIIKFRLSLLSAQLLAAPQNQKTSIEEEIKRLLGGHL